MSLFDNTDLASDVNLIINSGAKINLESNYENIKTVNVNGIKEMIKFSISVSPPIKLVTISSFSVFNNYKLKDGEEFDEQVQLPNIEILEKEESGYIQSKIVSEYLLMNASNKFNIPSMIIRSPTIFVNPYTNIGAHDLFQTLFLASHAIGYFPILDINILVSTITWTSTNIMKVILNEKCWELSKSPISKSTSIYNINGEIQRSEILLEPLKKQFGCKEISFYEWSDKVLHSNLIPCKRFSLLNNNDFLMKLKIDKGLGVSKNTKLILQTMGFYGGFENNSNNVLNLIQWGNSLGVSNNDFNISGVSDKMIINSIIYNNKATSSNL